MEKRVWRIAYVKVSSFTNVSYKTNGKSSNLRVILGAAMEKSDWLIVVNGPLNWLGRAINKYIVQNFSHRLEHINPI